MASEQAQLIIMHTKVFKIIKGTVVCWMLLTIYPIMGVKVLHTITSFLLGSFDGVLKLKENPVMTMHDAILREERALKCKLHWYPRFYNHVIVFVGKVPSYC